MRAETLQDAPTMNGHLSWFRLWADAVDDEKLRLLAFEDRWHFVAILCCKAQGLLDEPGDLMARKIAVKLGLQLRELDEVARRLAEVGLIDQADFQPIAWDRRQYASDRSTERVRKFRERQQDETLQERCRNADETPMKRSRNAAETETETETEEPFALTRAEKTARSEPKKVFVQFVNGEQCPVGRFDVDKQIRLQWLDAYPGIQVGTELEKAAAWVMANPTKRKSDWRRFLNNWMARAQERTK